MIEFPIVDAHLHLWDPSRFQYPWLADLPILNRPFGLADYQTACGDVLVEQMVFLQCEVVPAQAHQEADWVTQLADEDPRIAGLVPWAPLELGERAQSDLDVLAENRLVKGVRRIIQFEDNPEFCLQPKFIEGVQLLAELNLSFDLCIAHHQLATTIQLVQRCPDVRFMLDHIGKPGIKEQLMQPWRSELQTLAALPNVWCKVSGLVVEADCDRWKPADLHPYLQHVFDTFGFDRVLFGSDWPVVIQAASLQTWIDTLWQEVSQYSATERERLFRTNAIDFYRLDSYDAC